MSPDDELVEVRDPDGTGWIAAKFLEIAEPTQVHDPAANDGKGYKADRYRVQYLEGDREGTTGLHMIGEIRRAAE